MDTQWFYWIGVIVVVAIIGCVVVSDYLKTKRQESRLDSMISLTEPNFEEGEEIVVLVCQPLNNTGEKITADLEPSPSPGAWIVLQRSQCWHRTKKLTAFVRPCHISGESDYKQPITPGRYTMHWSLDRFCWTFYPIN